MNPLAEAIDRPEPTLAAVFTRSMRPKAIRRIASMAGVAELRADKMPSQSPRYLAHQAKRLAAAALPVLLTIRPDSEGGDWHSDKKDQKRLELFNRLLPEVDGIDIELAADIAPELIQAAHNLGKMVIVSSHDFDGTPSISELEDKYGYSLELDADYLKLATTARTIADYQRLAEFTHKYKGEDLITVAMGDLPIFRLGLVGLGSLLTYASTDLMAVAPGQMGCAETHEGLMYRYPGYADTYPLAA